MRISIGRLAVAIFALALAAGCRRAGAPQQVGAFPSQGPATVRQAPPRRPPEVHDTLAARVVKVLAVTFSVPKEQIVGIPKLAPGQRPPSWATNVTWRGQALSIGVTPQDGTISVGPDPHEHPVRPHPPTGDRLAGLAAAQVQAERMLDKLFTGEERRRLQPTAAGISEAGFYQVAWRGELSPGVTTGDSATFLFTSEGRLSGYTERRAPRRVQLSDLRISLENAKNLAMKMMRNRVSPGATWGPAATTLVLSSLLVPDQGPVWEIAVRVGPDPARERSAWSDTLVIDAVTGEPVTAPGPAGP